ncbi:DNA import protein CedA [Acidianus sp.]|uniref:DNA import protein CedA n=1 Tax=Acidianus sp. TaxID=1872104 RepID=UPI00397DF0FC
MFNIGEMLFLASSLGALTYFIGTLIMGLPIPIYGIKKWGPKLILDGLYVTALVNAYGSILALSSMIQSYLGATWCNFFKWVCCLIIQEIALNAFLRTIYGIIAVASGPTAGVLLSEVGVLFSLFGSLITTSETLLIIARIVYEYSQVFIALGILLISIPFRVGRGVGGSLIGFSIVFYAALPYLPNFLTSLGVNVLQNLNNIPNNNACCIIVYLMTKVIPLLIEGTIVLPIAYMIILSGISIGVGAAISGYSFRLPIPIEIF